MKRGIILFILVVLLSSFISADIIFNQQFNPLYNLGDTIPVPVTIKTLNDVSGMFQMDLICNGTAVNFYKNGVNLVSGAEKNFDSSLVLIKNIIGNSKGLCRIKAILNGDYALSKEFKISDLLLVEGSLQKTEFDSGENLAITGKVTRETGENSDGFADVALINNLNQEALSQSGTVTEGRFNISISLPKNLKAGNYSAKLTASEKNSDGSVTNTGFSKYNISVRQVPTNLELIIENKEVNPGEPLKIRAVLHDQTGEKIDSTAFITIKNTNDKIVEQKELRTDELFEYPIKNDEPPAEWKISATSNKLTTETNLYIKTKEDIKIEVANETIFITNTGNVPYDKIILVKVGDTPMNIDVTLKVGESKKYVLTAPDGEYNVKVSSGEKSENQVMSLTGSAVGIKEISKSYGVLLWIFLILIIVIVLFLVFKKIYKKHSLKKTEINSKKKDKNMPIIGSPVTKTENKAEVSLSIKGEKQDASVICLRVKDLKETKSKKGSASETIQKIIDLIEENKAVTYENQDYFFFIFAPIKTRTFKNEKTALKIAEKISDILNEHNKMFNQKIDFGISLNYGTIVAKIENGIFKFMSMGTLITVAKKIASLSKGEVLLSDKMNDLLRLSIRTEKQIKDGISVFSVKEIKKENEEARKFIDRFLRRQEKEKK